MGAGASKVVGENTCVKTASATLISETGGGATINASRRKSEPSSTIKAKTQASKLSTQGKKRPKKADPSELDSLKSKKVLASSSSMENLPGLTITPSPKSTPQPHSISSSNLAILPE